MALSRKLLENMGIESNNISIIIDAHAETVDALKAKIEDAKADSERLAEVREELEKAKKDLEERDSKNEDYKAKYEKAREELEAFKSETANKEAQKAKEDAFRQLLKETGVSEKSISSIVKVTDLTEMKLEDGEFKDKESIVSKIKKDWDGFITSSSTSGAQTTTPASTSAGGKMSKEDIYKRDDRGRYILSASERQQAIADNPEAFSN